MKTHKRLNMYSKHTEELKKLIAEHPNYPIVVLVNGELAADDSYYWWYAPNIRFTIGELLDCEQDINDEKIYSDRDEFEEDIRYRLECSEFFDKWDGDEFEMRVRETLEEYESYWIDVIAIYADT